MIIKTILLEYSTPNLKCLYDYQMIQSKDYYYCKNPKNNYYLIYNYLHKY